MPSRPYVRSRLVKVHTMKASTIFSLHSFITGLIAFAMLYILDTLIPSHSFYSNYHTLPPSRWVGGFSFEVRLTSWNFRLRLAFVHRLYKTKITQAAPCHQGSWSNSSADARYFGFNRKRLCIIFAVATTSCSSSTL